MLLERTLVTSVMNGVLAFYTNCGGVQIEFSDIVMVVLDITWTIQVRPGVIQVIAYNVLRIFYVRTFVRIMN